MFYVISTFGFATANVAIRPLIREFFARCGEVGARPMFYLSLVTLVAASGRIRLRVDGREERKIVPTGTYNIWAEPNVKLFFFEFPYNLSEVFIPKFPGRGFVLQLKKHAETKAIVIGATGKAFVAGADIGFFIECIKQKRLDDNTPAWLAAKMIHSNAHHCTANGQPGYDKGYKVPLAEGLKEELAHLNEIFSTADALTELTSVGRGRPTFASK
jgi:hypothetical protein